MKIRFVKDPYFDTMWDVQVKFLGVWLPTLRYFSCLSKDSDELLKRYKEKYCTPPIEFEINCKKGTK